ncbi:DUF3995 domain-containing protein [Streptomyces sp. NPDC090029]|uniref:DUF3995 domain-containing protein n=1 Tax=Streptomyces sp. NPDC090029 TaxID=3365924 RepID=UPI0037F66010
MHEDRQRRTIAGVWGRIACAWAVAFATLHFYWALGGDWGLRVSAGPLAEERPGWFVAVGLWGAGALCLVGGVLGWLLTRPHPRGLAGRLVKALGWGVCAVLLVRGIAVEVLLLTNTSGQEIDVSPEQRLWTLLLWNPWFLVGGLAFGLAARGAGRSKGARSGTA